VKNGRKTVISLSRHSISCWIRRRIRNCWRKSKETRRNSPNIVRWCSVYWRTRNWLKWMNRKGGRVEEWRTSLPRRSRRKRSS